MVGRAFSANCGAPFARLATGINVRKHGAKYEVAIPAVPLRSLPTNNVIGKPENRVSPHDKVHDKGPYTVNTTDDTSHQSDELWKPDSDELTALIAEAKEFLNILNTRYPMYKNHQPPSLGSDAFHPRTSVEDQKVMMETAKLEKRARDEVLATPVIRQCSDRSFSGKRLKVSSEISEVILEEKSCRTETMLEDSDNEVCILSPAEWNVLQRRSNKKDECAEPSVWKLDKKQERRSSRELDKECRNVIDPQQIDVESVSGGGKSDLQNERFPNCEVTKTKCKEGDELELRQGKNTKGPHLEAESLKLEGMNVSTDKPFGHIPGIKIGDEFSFREELAIVGLNCQLTHCVDFVTLGGKQYATSIVNLGPCENEAREDNTLIYSHQDQTFEGGNLALMNSMKMGYPVRIIHKRKCKHDYVYVYDGLYKVNRCWQDKNSENSNLVIKFELHRLRGRPVGHSTDICMLDDVSQGKEKFKVGVVNEVDEELPLPFTYITSIVYPPHLLQQGESIACDCVDGCSDSVKCPCVIKNGGEIPFTEKGLIMRARPNNIVHECGPSCKCPPWCMNRVSQHSPRFLLEIFKTKSMGWGVRSQDYIMPGSFICEYIGEVVGEKEAEKRIGNDEYLFDIVCNGKSKKDDFALDAAKFGNVGRFINHSCDPNVFAQRVVYDNKVPHIMFFAGKRIPPRTELRYDYNYSKICVRDANGKIKRKDCHCGTRKCTGRLY